MCPRVTTKRSRVPREDVALRNNSAPPRSYAAAAAATAGESNWYEDRDAMPAGSSALFRAMPDGMKAPWMNNRAEVRRSSSSGDLSHRDGAAAESRRDGRARPIMPTTDARACVLRRDDDDRRSTVRRAHFSRLVSE